VKLGLGQGEILPGKQKPNTMVIFRKIKFAHPVFKLSRKNSRFFPEYGIQTARLYIVLQNLAEADHLYHKHSQHL